MRYNEVTRYNEIQGINYKEHNKYKEHKQREVACGSCGVCRVTTEYCDRVVVVNRHSAAGTGNTSPPSHPPSGSL